MVSSAEQLARQIDENLGDLKDDNPNWRVDTSPNPGRGRGIIANRDILSGELIFRERALIIGPTARKGTALNTCVICYKLLDEENIPVCPKGCALPTCPECSDAEEHKIECNLFQRWQPIDVSHVNPQTLRILTAVRSFFLNKDQRELLFSMQANADRYYRLEIERAAEGFKNFPKDQKVIDYIYRTVCVLNTNAFEARSIVQGHEILQRGLFALAGTMNHECTPNACHYFENGNLIYVKAAKFIPKDAEITTTYTKIMWSNLSRRVFLKMTKHFFCDCSRCKDPTENGTYLAALYCREPNCKGWTIPVHTTAMQPDWKCGKCGVVSSHAKMGKYQDFTLSAIHNKINSCSVHDMINFINNICPRFCPPSNYVLVEAKLNVIWRMQRINDDYTDDEYLVRDQYCKDVIEILDKLEAGDCTLRKLITNEINSKHPPK
ncbi:SET domain-containing protein SmydA-8 isoform X1 [Eupeodes corollae]|uniref:SET domain-containing protein SmydA-8 isoform X1 n=1 Tax=Eupeodes corollae TaxID=290404 RepID=UPI00249075D8|nr:SET domain-containing protein SmydA-8 isoform X1 [Eupeodes corollae]